MGSTGTGDGRGGQGSVGKAFWVDGVGKGMLLIKNLGESDHQNGYYYLAPIMYQALLHSSSHVILISLSCKYCYCGNFIMEEI